MNVEYIKLYPNKHFSSYLIDEISGVASAGEPHAALSDEFVIRPLPPRMSKCVSTAAKPRWWRLLASYTGSICCNSNPGAGLQARHD